jgi:hypothetical protein
MPTSSNLYGDAENDKIVNKVGQKTKIVEVIDRIDS